MIFFKCAYCDAVLKVADAYAGKKARCPKCNGVMRVPDPADARDPAVARADPAEGLDGLDAGLLSEAIEQDRRAPPTGTRPCGVCGGVVGYGAAICRHCGALLRGAAKTASRDRGVEAPRLARRGSRLGRRARRRVGVAQPISRSGDSGSAIVADLVSIVWERVIRIVVAVLSVLTIISSISLIAENAGEFAGLGSVAGVPRGLLVASGLGGLIGGICSLGRTATAGFGLIRGLYAFWGGNLIGATLGLMVAVGSQENAVALIIVFAVGVAMLVFGYGRKSRIADIIALCIPLGLLVLSAIVSLLIVVLSSR